MRARVFIATTKGPVHVQRIAREDPDLQSVMCLNGLAQPLPISGQYHDFVRRGTGVIERKFGHGAFRADLDGTIESGVSWQLPMYLAHAIVHHGGQLAGIADDDAPVILSTGAVRADLGLAGVGEVPRKLAAAAARIKAWQAAGVPVAIMVPHTNAADVATGALADLGLPRDGVTWHAVLSADAAWTTVLAAIGPPKPAAEPDTGAGRGPALRWRDGLVGVGLVAIAAFLIPGPDRGDRGDRDGPPAAPVPEQDGAEDPSDSPRLLVASVPPGQPCGPDDAVRTRRLALSPDRPNAFGATPVAGLCGLWLIGQEGDWTGFQVAFGDGTVRPLARDDVGWQVPIPGTAFETFDYGLYFIDAGAAETVGPDLRAMLSELRDEAGRVSARALETRLRDRGWRVRVYRHELFGL